MNCFKTGLLVAAACGVSGVASAGVIVTGVLDGDLSGGNPKAIELYVTGTEDLSNYTLFRSANGAAFANTNAVLTGSYSDTYVYLVGSSNSGEAAFDSVFGTTGIFANRAYVGSQVNGNGDDGFQIRNAAGDTVIDQVWTEDTNNSYIDSFWYRNDNTGPDGGWVPTNWTAAGNGSLDGLDAAQHTAAIPFGTYQVPEPGSLALLALGGLLIARRRRSA